MREDACRITGDFFAPPPAGHILPGMMRTQSDANWSGVPSLSQLLLAALLRLAAMFVVGAADPLRMLLTLLARECHTDVKRDRLPAMDSGKSGKAEPAATHSQTSVNANTSHRGSFSGKARSAASRESRFDRHGDRQAAPQSLPSANRDSRDALRLPGNDSGWSWESQRRPRP